MEMRSWITVLLLTALLLTACGAPAAQTALETPGSEETARPEIRDEPVLNKSPEEPLNVLKVEDLPEDFILGMDVSSLIAEEESGVRYYDFEGNERDLLELLAENGITHIRVRVWNDPRDAEGRGYGGGNCDLDCAVKIGKRATAAGMKLIVDFHYSDFWADPGKQRAPKAWEELDPEAKAEAVYLYTVDSLSVMKAEGVDVAMVQVGNEINNGMCGETDWEKILPMLASGSRAVREVYPEALVAVHFTEPQKKDGLHYFAKILKDGGLDYDVFGCSYYPFWHGSRENLTAVLTDVRMSFGKKVMVMETSYPYTGEDTDFSGNSVGADSGLPMDYPFTVQGQADELRDVAAAVAKVPDGIGVCWWEGAWISVGKSSWEENNKLWEQFGSGWASIYAGDYDEEAGKWYGGSSWDNQAFFDARGKALESLRVFSLLRSGQGDQTPRATPAPSGPALADQGNNLLQNGSFESGELSPWELEDRGSGGELYVEEKAGDSLDGSWHMHFWNPGRDCVDFTLQQTVSIQEEGDYSFSISIMGGDCGETEIFAFVMADGEELAAAPLGITSWNNWDTAKLDHLALSAGQSVTVGIRVKVQGAGNGGWGKIDSAFLTRED